MYIFININQFYISFTQNERGVAEKFFGYALFGCF